MGKVLITNIGKIVSGDLKRGILAGDTILIENGLIAGIGWQRQFDAESVEKVVDADSMVVIPGLIDSHVHATLEDWNRSLRVYGWMETTLLAGTTTLVSALTGLSGMSLDPYIVKTVAMLAQKTLVNQRPGDYQKVHGGVCIPVHGFTEADFREMGASEGHMTFKIGPAGIGDIKDNDFKQQVEWAKKYGMIVVMHMGGASILGSTGYGADEIMEVNPDIVAHINGGPTAPPLEDAEKLINETDYILEVIHNGNAKVMYEVVRMLKEKGALHRLIIGSDSITGIGFLPLAVHRVIVQLSSFNQILAQDVIAMATGSTADVFGFNTGKVEVGREADLVVIDRPTGSVGKDALGAIEVGDTFAVAMVMVDGHIVTLRGRDTMQSTKNVKINGVEHKVDTFEEWICGARHPGY